MVDVTKELSHLEEVKRLIERGEVLVAEQERRLAQLQSHGHPTEDAKQTLATFKSALQALLTAQTATLGTLHDIEEGKLPATPPAA